MANNSGTATFTTGPGTKTISVGMVPTWMQLRVRKTGVKPFEGYIYGGDQYCYSDETSGAVNKAIQIKDTSGTIVVEGTWTSFASNNVNFNLTTNTLGVFTALLIFGN